MTTICGGGFDTISTSSLINAWNPQFLTKAFAIMLMNLIGLVKIPQCLEASTECAFVVFLRTLFHFFVSKLHYEKCEIGNSQLSHNLFSQLSRQATHLFSWHSKEGRKTTWSEVEFGSSILVQHHCAYASNQFP